MIAHTSVPNVLRIAFVHAVLVLFALTACNSEPTNAQSNWKRRYEAIEMKRSDASRESRALLRTALTSGFGDSDFRQFLVAEAYIRDLNPLAHAQLKALQEEIPGDIDLQRAVGRILREEGFLEESATYLAHRFSIEPYEPSLFSELLTTHISSDALDQAQKLFDSTELPKKSFLYHKVASRLYELRGDYEQAFWTLFQSLADTSYSLGSQTFRTLSRLARKLHYPLVDRHFYSLYRPTADPADVALLYSCAESPALYEISESTLLVTLISDSLLYTYTLGIVPHADGTSFLIPLILPAGLVVPSEIALAPQHKFKLTQRGNGKTRLHEITLEKPIVSQEELLVTISFHKKVAFPRNSTPLWEELPVLHSATIELATEPGFGIDSATLIRVNREEGRELLVQTTARGCQIRPASPTMFFMPSIPFWEYDALLFLANELGFGAAVAVLVAVCCNMLIRRRAAAGIGLTLLICSLVCGGFVAMSTVPSLSFIIDLPGALLARFFSPRENFPQQTLATIIAFVVGVLGAFAVWLSSTIKVDYKIPEEAYGIMCFPNLVLLSYAGFQCFWAAKITITTFGWDMPAYVYAADVVLLMLCVGVLLRCWQWDLISTGIGAAIGIGSAEWAFERVWARPVLDVLFVLFMVGALVSIWLRFRQVRGALPREVQSGDPLRVRVQVSLAAILDRYRVAVRVGAILSGIVVFIYHFMGIVRERG